MVRWPEHGSCAWVTAASGTPPNVNSRSRGAVLEIFGGLAQSIFVRSFEGRSVAGHRSEKRCRRQLHCGPCGAFMSESSAIGTATV